MLEPALTVADLLDLTPFASARSRLVAGGAGTDSAVTGAHSSEMPSPAHLFRGGEVLLTQGRGISRVVARQRQFVNELSEANVAALALETGYAYEATPTHLREAADAAGLPLIEMERPAYFMSMIETIHALVSDAGVDPFHRLALAAAQDGQALSRVLDELSRQVEAPVVLSDERGRVQEVSPQTEEVLALLQGWHEHAKSDHRYRVGEILLATAGGLRCAYCVVAGNGGARWTLHVMTPSRPLSGLSRRLILRTTDLVALLTGSQAGADFGTGTIRAQMLVEMLSGTAPDSPTLTSRASALGLDLQGEMVIAVGCCLDPKNHSRAQMPRIPSLSARLHGAARVAQHLLDQLREEMLCERLDDRLHLVFGWAGPLDGLATVMHQVAANGPYQSQHPLLLTYSAGAPAPQLPGAAASARDTLRIAMKRRWGPGAYQAQASSLHRVLLHLEDSGLLQDLIHEELTRLLAHDARSSATPLLPTLKALMRSSGNNAQVARELNIDRRTLYQRLSRLRPLLESDLNEPAGRLRVQLALEGQDL